MWTGGNVYLLGAAVFIAGLWCGIWLSSVAVNQRPGVD